MSTYPQTVSFDGGDQRFRFWSWRVLHGNLSRGTGRWAHPFRVRCGQLPDLLRASLQLAGAIGILGNEILRDRTLGYFPLKKPLIL